MSRLTLQQRQSSWPRGRDVALCAVVPFLMALACQQTTPAPLAAASVARRRPAPRRLAALGAFRPLAARAASRPRGARAGLWQATPAPAVAARRVLTRASTRTLVQEEVGEPLARPAPAAWAARRRSRPCVATASAIRSRKSATTAQTRVRPTPAPRARCRIWWRALRCRSPTLVL